MGFIAPGLFRGKYDGLKKAKQGSEGSKEFEHYSFQLEKSFVLWIVVRAVVPHFALLWSPGSMCGAGVTEV